MHRTIHDPIVKDVDSAVRAETQETFGRHIVENRNRMAELARQWIEGLAQFPIPIYDRLLDRIRCLDPSVRADVASISLLMADQIVSGILSTFDKGDEMKAGDAIVNYAVIAQIRHPGDEVVVETIDVNCGRPVMAMWDRYKKWLTRFAPSRLRAVASVRRTDSEREP